VANICPFPILKGRLTLMMDKLKVIVKNMYLQTRACMFTINLFAYVVHQHGKNMITIMARIKRGKITSISEMMSITNPPTNH
jgi:hypothetical protein